MGVRSRVPGAARIRVGASLMSITKQKILTIVVISAGIGALTSVAGYSLWPQWRRNGRRDGRHLRRNRDVRTPPLAEPVDSGDPGIVALLKRVWVG